MVKKAARTQPPLDGVTVETNITPLEVASTEDGGAVLRLSPAMVRRLGWDFDGIVYFKVDPTDDDPASQRALIVEVR